VSSGEPVTEFVIEALAGLPVDLTQGTDSPAGTRISLWPNLALRG